MGDLNLNFLRGTNPPSGQKEEVNLVKGFMADNTVKQTVDKPTRVATMGDTVTKTWLITVTPPAPSTSPVPRWWQQVTVITWARSLVNCPAKLLISQSVQEF